MRQHLCTRLPGEDKSSSRNEPEQESALPHTILEDQLIIEPIYLPFLETRKYAGRILDHQ